MAAAFLTYLQKWKHCHKFGNDARKRYYGFDVVEIGVRRYNALVTRLAELPLKAIRRGLIQVQLAADTDPPVSGLSAMVTIGVRLFKAACPPPLSAWLTSLPAPFQQARLRAHIWYANLSFHVQACVCARQPEQAHGHDCEVSGQCKRILLSILQVTVQMWLHIITQLACLFRCCASIQDCLQLTWNATFKYWHTLLTLTERSAVLNCSHLNGSGRETFGNLVLCLQFCLPDSLIWTHMGFSFFMSKKHV